jgi:MFS family permease
MSTPEKDKQSAIRKLMIFFGLAYFMQLIAQASGVVNQPLDFFFKEALGLDPVQVTEYLAVLTIPWVIKPIYGIITDFVPIFGYRRKSWLLIMSAMAACGFFWLTGLNDPKTIVIALMITAFGTAFCDVITDAVMVENGQKADADLVKNGQEPKWTKKFQSIQWFWASVASMLTAFLGSRIAHHFGAAAGLHVAALVCAFAPLCVMVATWFLVTDEKVQVSKEQFKNTTGGYLSVFKSKPILIVALFIFFYNFSPSFGVPFYYHMVDNLKFDQAFIGNMGIVGSLGAVLGAWIFSKFLAGRFSNKQLICLSIVMGAAGTLAYLFLVNHTTALILSFVTGIAGMIANLTILGLAGEHCPKRAEGFTFAALMSVFNLATQLSAIIGARLYQNYFDSQLTPLIWVSAAFTLAAFILVPFLPKPPVDDSESADKK